MYPYLSKIIISTVMVILLFNQLIAQETTLDWKMHNVGKVRQVVTNNGALNAAEPHNKKYNYPFLINSEYPVGSNEEHIYLSGLWIGAITPTPDTLVSVTRSHFTEDEFYATNAPWDSVWVVRKGDTVDIPYLGDYTAISDQDFVCRYSDYNLLNIQDHNPLYLDVIQRSHAWSSPPLDQFIVLQYDIVPTRNDLKDVYIAYWQQGEVGDNSIGDNWIDDLTYFYPEMRMGTTLDGPGGNDATAIGPIGVKVLSPADTANELSWSYHNYTHTDLYNIGRDRKRYEKISEGLTMENLIEPQRSHWTLSVGPFEQLRVGDTLHFELALVFGEGEQEMLENAEYLEFLSTRNFRVPSPPPKPELVVKPSSQQVRLSWYPSDDATNPENYRDPYRGDGEETPFEGYRLYKSTKSKNGPWTLLAEFDIDGNQYGFNTGLQYEYIDDGLLDNFEYFYTLTSYSKPDSVTDFPSLESSLGDNSVRVVPSTEPPETIGKVKVVPNPYRGDIAYHKYDPPWEKVPGSRLWMEQDRRIQFINLPQYCEIKIYTLAGDLVQTIMHNSPSAGFENWNLTSSVGQAVASGIYLFTVEDLNSGDVQTGKFVIIK